MRAIVEQALPLWGFEGARYDLIAARENAVHRISHSGQTAALRVHRKGYRTDAELTSELAWMAAVKQAGISVPAPIPSTLGQMLHIVEGIQVDVLTWLGGTPLADTIAALPAPSRSRIFHDLGRTMAQLHLASDGWAPPRNFTRCRWDADGLVGDRPLWDRFWCAPGLSPEDQALFTCLRGTAHEVLDRIGATLDFGLIHADLVSANVLLDGDQLHVIDFDDGGYGYRLLEIATALLKFDGDPDYTDLRRALVQGYQSARPIDLRHLDLFMCLRAASYVGWNITRMAEDGAAARNDRFVATARRLATAYLAER